MKTRVLPGMQAAFVDIGLERAAFLYISDVKNMSKMKPSVIQPPTRTLPPARKYTSLPDLTAARPR